MKRIKILFGICMAFVATLTMVSDSFGQVAEHAGHLLRENIDGVSIAVVSPIMALSNYAGKYERKLFSTMINELDVAQDITVMRNIRSTYKMTKLTVEDGLRPYDKNEQIRGTLNYKDRDLVVELFKREEGIEIKKYYDTWMEEELTKALEKEGGVGSSSAQSVIPFAQQTWEEVFKKNGQEINDKTAYFGFDKNAAAAYGAGTVYTAGQYMQVAAADGFVDFWKATATTTAGQSPTTTPAKWQKVNAEAVTPGLGYRLQEDITATTVTPINIGVINNTSVYAYEAFTELFRSLPDVYRKFGVIAYCSWTDFDLLLDDFETKVGKFTETERKRIDNGKIFLPKSENKCEVRACSWMSGSRRIIMTPKQNLLMGTDLLSDMKRITEVKAELWQAKYGISGTLGFGIRDAAALRCNDQA